MTIKSVRAFFAKMMAPMRAEELESPNPIKPALKPSIPRDDLVAAVDTARGKPFGEARRYPGYAGQKTPSAPIENMPDTPYGMVSSRVDRDMRGSGLAPPVTTPVQIGDKDGHW